jgi:hypothetical protein
MHHRLSQFFKPANIEILVVAGMLLGWLTLQAVVFPALGVPT